MPSLIAKIGSAVAFFIGLLVCVYLVSRIGSASVMDAILRVGAIGFVVIVASGFVLELLPGLALGVLIGGPARWPVFVAARQLRDSIGDLLPFTQFAGIVAAGRIVILAKCSKASVFAGSVADVTAEFVTQIIFMSVGLLLGAAQLAANPATAPYLGGLALSTGALVLGAAVFVVMQWQSSAFAAFLAGRVLPENIRRTRAFTDTLSQLYTKPGRLLLAMALHLASWLASGLWVWIIIHLMGGKISVGSAIAIQSILEVFRSAAVFVPTSIGVQEAGYAALAPVFGLGPEIGLAVSLLRRARDVAVGIPVLAAWQIFEGSRLLRDRDQGSEVL